MIAHGTQHCPWQGKECPSCCSDELTFIDFLVKEWNEKSSLDASDTNMVVTRGITCTRMPDKAVAIREDV